MVRHLFNTIIVLLTHGGGGGGAGILLIRQIKEQVVESAGNRCQPP